MCGDITGVSPVSAVPPEGTTTPVLPGLVDVAPLGHGGFSDVYLGRQVHLERWVAATVFRVVLDDPAAADRFRVECRALGRLDQHPHVITVHDAGVLPDGRPYLISERCDGSLADAVAARGPLPVPRAVAIGLATARALLSAHEAGVLHGDVTPRNVLLRASGTPVLADFGMAVLRERRGAPAAGYAASHAAPETVLHGVVDPACDVFGLGSTLWTALTGTPPFPGHPSGEAVRLARIETGPPAAPHGMPPRLADLLSGMLAADPGRRPTVAQVVDTLAGPRPSLTVPAPRPATGQVARPRGPVAPAPRRRSGGLLPWLVVAAAALVGACLGAWWYVADGGSVPAATPSSIQGAAGTGTAPVVRVPMS